MLELRTKILIGAASLCLLFMGVSGWSNWFGKFTYKAENQPLSEVIRKIERKFGVKIATNLNPDTPVIMRVQKAPLPEVMESLSIAVDADWQLSYAIASNKAEAQSLLDSWAAREQNRIYRTSGGRGGRGGRGGPGGFGGGDLNGSDEIEDPRTKVWPAVATESGTFRSYLEQLSFMTGTQVYYPLEFNPTLSKAPSKGKLSKALKSLAKASGGDVIEVFTLSRGGGRGWDGGEGRRPEGGNLAQGPRGQGANANFDFNRNRGGESGRGQGRQGDVSQEERNRWMEIRRQEELAKLSKAEREERERREAEFRAERERMAQMSPEERARQFEERMNDPQVQAAMEARQEARDRRTTPEKRQQRAKNYVERKREIRNGGN